MRAYAKIHDAKLDALQELVEELNGQPLLLAFEFRHDLDRIRERFGAGLPCLGGGASADQEAQWIEKWNRNELAMLACHPASAGHGLNLQEGSAAHVCWFSPIFDLELWDQFIRRVRRSGNDAQRIFNHVLVVKDSIDELKLAALADKDVTQTRLLRALNQEIRRDAEAQADGETLARNERIQNMAITRLGAAPNGAAAPSPAVAALAPQPMPAGIRPAGWPQATVGSVQQLTTNPEAEQRERIQQQLTGFSPQVQQQAAAIAPPHTTSMQTLEYRPPAEAPVEATKATRTRKAKEEPATAAVTQAEDAATRTYYRLSVVRDLLELGGDYGSIEEMLGDAEKIMAFIEG